MGSVLRDEPKASSLSSPRAVEAQLLDGAAPIRELTDPNEKSSAIFFGFRMKQVDALSFDSEPAIGYTQLGCCFKV